MDIKILTSKLKEISDKEKIDFYVSIHTDQSSVIKIIGEDKFFLSSQTLPEFEKNIEELIEIGLKKYIFKYNNGSYKVFIDPNSDLFIRLTEK